MYTYIRTCQSCGYKLRSPTQPKDTTSKGFINRKCPKCRSESFDFGSYQNNDPDHDYTTD